MQNHSQTSESIPAGLLSLAMAFVPYQSFETPYEPALAFSRGEQVDRDTLEGRREREMNPWVKGMRNGAQIILGAIVGGLVGIGIGSDDHRDAARTPRLFERDAADTRNDRPRGPVAGLHRDPHRHRR